MAHRSRPRVAGGVLRKCHDLVASQGDVRSPCDATDVQAVCTLTFHRGSVGHRCDFNPMPEFP